MPARTYSFKNIVGTIQGEGGSLNIASGAAVSQDGITVEFVDDVNVLTIGADGEAMHSHIAGSAATITVNLLKTSPTNAALSEMFNLQNSMNAIGWGHNTITFRDVERGDVIVGEDCAFRHQPTINYGREGDTVQWVFDSAFTSYRLGVL